MYKIVFVILLVTASKSVGAQRIDTAFNKDFDVFRQLTDTLIAELKMTGINQTHIPDEPNIPSAIVRRCEQLKAKLKEVDAHGWFALKMSDYYDKGKRIASQDSSSKDAQQQCTYYYFTEVFRKPVSIVEQIWAALDASDWFVNGFPSNKYCPFYYAPVEVNFGPVRSDTISQKRAF